MTNHSVNEDAAAIAVLEPVAIRLKVGERENVLRLPVNAIFEDDGVTAVHVLQSGRVEPRQVEIGEQNQRFVEVTAGVAAGDRVMLVGDTPAADDVLPATAGDGKVLDVDLDKLVGNGDFRMGSLR